jgi:hypothetical protein
MLEGEKEGCSLHRPEEHEDADEGERNETNVQHLDLEAKAEVVERAGSSRAPSGPATWSFTTTTDNQNDPFPMWLAPLQLTRRQACSGAPRRVESGERRGRLPHRVHS